MACPSKECSNLLACMSNILTKPSIDPHAKYFPSGLWKKEQKDSFNNCLLKIKK
jgi:hypothetical protein